MARKNIIHPVTTLKTGEILRRSIWSFVSFEFCDSIAGFSRVMIYWSIAIASNMPIKHDRRKPVVTIPWASRMRYRDGSMVSNIGGKIEYRNIFCYLICISMPILMILHFSNTVLLENFFVFAILPSISFFSLLQVSCPIRLISSHLIFSLHRVTIWMWLDFFHSHPYMLLMLEKNILIPLVLEKGRPMISHSRIHSLWHDFVPSKHSISRDLSFLRLHFWGPISSISNLDFRPSICVHHLNLRMEPSIFAHWVPYFLPWSMRISLLASFLCFFIWNESKSKWEKKSRDIVDRSFIPWQPYYSQHFQFFFIRNFSSRLRMRIYFLWGKRVPWMRRLKKSIRHVLDSSEHTFFFSHFHGFRMIRSDSRISRSMVDSRSHEVLRILRVYWSQVML